MKSISHQSGMSLQFIAQKIILALLLVIACIVSNYSYAASLGNATQKFTDADHLTAADWTDPDELQRVWQNALVRIPIGAGKYLSAVMRDLGGKQLVQQAYPTVIYLHGCAGVWSGTYTRLNILAAAGFAVIAPVSFAREKYPQSCDPVTQQGGLFRDILKIRLLDARYAVQQARQLSWVNTEQLFLMGLSEGGITVAAYTPENSLQSVKARVIEGWTCHSGWPEYAGINASVTEPVLSLLGRHDPWFQDFQTQGDCGRYMHQSNGSQSIVFEEGYLASRHELLEDKSVQKSVLQFLNQQIQ